MDTSISEMNPPILRRPPARRELVLLRHHAEVGAVAGLISRVFRCGPAAAAEFAVQSSILDEVAIDSLPFDAAETRLQKAVRLASQLGVDLRFALREERSLPIILVEG